MKNISKVAILGGAGRTGVYLINQLLEKGFNVKALVRNPDPYTIQNSRLEIIKGDAVDEKIIWSLLEDCQAVISTVGQRPGETMVASQSAKNILKVMGEFGIERYLLLAGINIDTPFDGKSPKTILATDWMKTNFPEIQKDRQLAYDILTASTVQWTMVRVPLIEFTDRKTKIIADLKDCVGDKISASNIAAFMIEEMIQNEFWRESPLISAV